MTVLNFVIKTDKNISEGEHGNSKSQNYFEKQDETWRTHDTDFKTCYYKATEIKKWGLAQDQCTSMIRNADPRNIRNIYMYA